jgi:hypothetical protein
MAFNLKQNTWIEQVPPLPYDYLGFPRDQIRVRQVEAKLRSDTLLVGVVTTSFGNGMEVQDFALYDSSKNSWTRVRRFLAYGVLSLRLLGLYSVGPSFRMATHVLPVHPSGIYPRRFERIYQIWP